MYSIKPKGNAETFKISKNPQSAILENSCLKDIFLVIYIMIMELSGTMESLNLEGSKLILMTKRCSLLTQRAKV